MMYRRSPVPEEDRRTTRFEYSGRGGNHQRHGGAGARHQVHVLCPDHERQEWHDTWRQYNGRSKKEYCQPRGQQPRKQWYQPKSVEKSTESTTGSVRTIGVLEVRGRINQKEGRIIIDTGACVSCIDESLVAHPRNKINPVQGVDLKTATDEPVHIVGRTDLVIEISHCIMTFSVFVAKGLGPCCILGNDFHTKFGTAIVYKTNKVHFELPCGRTLWTPFISEEKEARYIQPPPDSTWLNAIQLAEPQEKSTSIRCADTTDIPPRSQRLLKISYVTPPPELGIVEGKYNLFKEESIIIPPGLITMPPPDKILVTNLSDNPKRLRAGEELAEVHEAQEVKEEVNRVNERHATSFDEKRLNINTALAREKREALLKLLTEYQDRFAWDTQQIGRTNRCELTIPLKDDVPTHQPPYRVSHREREK